MPGASRALVVLALLSASLAGCFAPSPGAPPCGIARIVEVTSAPQADEEASVQTSFRVTLHQAGDGRAWTVSYTDERGENRTRALAELGLAAFSPGAQVVVPDARLASAAVVRNGDAVACQRHPAGEPWWTLDGTPTGVLLAPGAQLRFALSSNGEFGVSGSDLRLGDGSSAVLERFHAGLRYEMGGELALAAGQDLVPWGGGREARNVTWSLSSLARFPSLLEFRSNVSNRSVESGLEVAQTAAHVAASGALAVDASRRILSLALARGSVDVDATIYGWTSDPSFPVTPGCEGKTRQDRCEPEGFDGMFPILYDLRPGIHVVQPRGRPPDAATLASFEAFLAHGVEPGDALSVVVAVTGADLNAAGFSSQRWPADLAGSLRFRLEATRVVDVSVPAGTFPAVELAQEMRLEASTEGEPGSLLGPVRLDETVSQATVHLHRFTFVPLRVESQSPVAFDALVETLLRALPESTWGALGRPDLSAMDFLLSGRSRVELSQVSGESRMSAWAAVAFAQALPAVATASLALVGPSLAPPGAGGGNGPPQGLLSSGTIDRDANARNDTVWLQLAVGGPYRPAEVRVFVDGFPLALEEICTVEPRGAPDAFSCDAAFESGFWLAGQRLYVDCREGENEVVVFLRDAVAYGALVPCTE